LIDKHQDSYEKLGGLLAKISNYKQKVILFGPRPEFPKIKTLYLNDYLYREFAKNGGWESSRGKNWDNEVAISVNKYVDLTNGEYFSRRKLRRDINAWLLKLTKEHSALFVDMEKIICDMANSSCFGVLPSMEKGIYDYGHYTLAGAAFFGHRLVQAEFFVSLNQ
jgi:hypothetical protein